MEASLPLADDPNLTPFLDELNQLFQKMDGAYDAAAKEHGFVCNGCDENCCKTLFYHHTFLEFICLAQGLQKLAAETRKALFKRAQKYVLAQSDASSEKIFRKMCPLNQDDRCQLYAHRPMICRLHGIPYLLGFGQAQKEGPGCDEFYQQTVKINPALDRTQLYQELAMLEKKVRGHLNNSSKIRLTIAEMIVAILGNDRDETT